MSLPDFDGKYRAVPVDWSVEDKENQTDHTITLQFIVQYHLTHFWTGNEWQDVSGHGFSIRGYHYLFKKDGSPNETTVRALQESLGWDGTISGLQNGDWSQVPVQITVGSSKWNNQVQRKVTWITKYDADPNAFFSKADPAAIQSLEAKYGSKLRAVSAPPTASVTPSKPKTVNAPQKATSGPAKGTKLAAWQTFVSLWDKFVAENPDRADTRDTVWKEALKDRFRGQDEKTITAAEWTDFAEVYLPKYDLSLIPF